MPPTKDVTKSIPSHRIAIAPAALAPINGRSIITIDISLGPTPFTEGSMLIMEATGITNRASFIEMCDLIPDARKHIAKKDMICAIIDRAKQ